MREGFVSTMFGLCLWLVLMGVCGWAVIEGPAPSRPYLQHTDKAWLATQARQTLAVQTAAINARMELQARGGR